MKYADNFVLGLKCLWSQSNPQPQSNGPGIGIQLNMYVPCYEISTKNLTCIGLHSFNNILYYILSPCLLFHLHQACCLLALVHPYWFSFMSCFSLRKLKNIVITISDQWYNVFLYMLCTTQVTISICAHSSLIFRVFTNWNVWQFFRKNKVELLHVQLTFSFCSVHLLSAACYSHAFKYKHCGWQDWGI